MTEPKSPARPSLEFLKLLCHACEDSAWCSHFYLTDRHGKSISCSAAPGRPDYIENLEVEFDTRPDTPEPKATPEPEFTCNDVRRDIRKVMKVPRKIASRVLDIETMRAMTETENIVTTLLGLTAIAMSKNAGISEEELKLLM